MRAYRSTRPLVGLAPVIALFVCGVVPAAHGVEFSEHRAAAGRGPSSVAGGDFDSDGLQDLIVTNSETNDVSVLLGLGDGTLQTEMRHGAGARPLSAAAGDLDGDGDLDVVVGNRGSSDVSVLLGGGDGTFEPERRIAAPARGIFDLALVDFDRDGHLDLLGIGFSAVGVHLGEGDGSFSPQWESFVIAGRALAVADFDGDGLEDIAVSGTYGDDVTIYVGDGRGDFEWAGIYFGYGLGPFSIDAGDIDSDGRMDLAIANRYSDRFTVLFGPHGTWYPPWSDFPVGGDPRSILIEDLDADGSLDVVTANGGTNDVSVLLGRGNGFFDGEKRFPAGQAPVSVVTGDFDGDGNTDLVTANSDSDDVSVLINQACPKNDHVPPVVTIVEPPEGYVLPIAPLTAPLSFESHDDDGHRGGVIHERLLIEDCELLDGDAVGDEDGLLSDEELSLDPNALCVAAQQCGVRVFTDPDLVVEATDCAGNVGAASRALRGTIGLRPGLCR